MTASPDLPGDAPRLDQPTVSRPVGEAMAPLRSSPTGWIRASTPIFGMTRRHPAGLGSAAGEITGEGDGAVSAIEAREGPEARTPSVAKEGDAGLALATRPARMTASAPRPRRQARERRSSGPPTSPASGTSARAEPRSGMPVFGRLTPPETVKHSVVALVCDAAS